MDRYEVSERFAKMYRKSRESQQKSQDFMAKSLGVSKKTIQNWECGLSSPSQISGFAWFQILGVNPMPYYIDLLFGNDDDLTDDSLDEVLTQLVLSLTPSQKKKLLYCMSGRHGSSASAILDMTLAHLQTPLRDRINIASSIFNNYEVAMARGDVRLPDDVQPDMDFLYYAMEKGKEAVKMGLDGYGVML